MGRSAGMSTRRQHAEVLSVDEKSQIQALDRTQPGQPMKKGRSNTMTHDYKRHGTTTLFAALNVLDGTLIAQNMQRHRHQEFDSASSTASSARCRRTRPSTSSSATSVRLSQEGQGPSLARPAFKMTHLRLAQPISGTLWLNARRRLLRQTHAFARSTHGVFQSVADLQAAINRFCPRIQCRKLDPSRKSGGALHRLHCFCLEFDGACEVQRRVPTDWIIEPVDVSGYGSFSLAS